MVDYKPERPILASSFEAFESIQDLELPPVMDSAYESYRILDLDSIAPQRLTGNPYWESLREGHVDAAAMLLETYDRIFLIARDGEFLYYTILALGNEEDRARVHLINVSRDSLDDPLLKDYLAESGLTDESIVAPGRTVLVDTGFKGTVIDAVRGLFDETLRPLISSHLLCSRVEGHPSLRAFLRGLNDVVSLDPWQMEGDLRPYEGLPHATHRCVGYAWNDSGLAPFSRRSPPSTGATIEENVSPEAMHELLADIRDFASDPLLQQRFLDQRQLWRETRDILERGDRQGLVEPLRNRLRQGHTSEVDAFTRDIVELTQFLNDPSLPQLVPQDVDLPPVSLRDLRMELQRTDPVIEEALFDAKVEVPALVRQGRWDDLRRLIDFFPSAPECFGRTVLLCRKELARALGASAPLQPALGVLQYWLNSENETAACDIATSAFKSPKSAAWQPLFRQLVDQEDQQVALMLALHACRYPHVQEWSTDIERLKEVAQGYVRETLEKTLMN